MIHMILDPRDRQRRWAETRPLRDHHREILLAMPDRGLEITLLHSDPEGRVPGLLQECRNALDRMEELYRRSQAYHAAFKPQYPLVPLVGGTEDA